MTTASIRRAAVPLNCLASARALHPFGALLAGGALLAPSLAATSGQDQFGKRTIHSGVMRAFLISLIVAEVGAFLVIFSGSLAA